MSSMSNSYYNSPVPQFTQETCWIAKTSGDGQSATLPTPKSTCGSPSGDFLGNRAASSHSDCKTTNINDERCSASASPDNNTRNSIDDDSISPSAEGKGTKHDFPACKRRHKLKSIMSSPVENLEFEIRQYDSTKTRSSVIRKIFDKQLEMLYRLVTNEFNGTFDSTQIGIESTFEIYLPPSSCRNY